MVMRVELTKNGVVGVSALRRRLHYRAGQVSACYALSVVRELYAGGRNDEIAL